MSEQVQDTLPLDAPQEPHDIQVRAYYNGLSKKKPREGIDDSLSLAHHRQRTMEKEHMMEGHTCPCCDQLVKMYSIKLSGSMVAQLIMLNRRSTEEWTHYQHVLLKKQGIGNFTKLKFWGLIEPKTTRTSDENSVGFWRITKKGKDFVNGFTTVPTHALIYNNNCHGFTEEHVNVRKALGTKFDYFQLMHGGMGR